MDQNRSQILRKSRQEEREELWARTQLSTKTEKPGGSEEVAVCLLFVCLCSWFAGWISRPGSRPRWSSSPRKPSPLWSGWCWWAQAWYAAHRASCHRGSRCGCSARRRWGSPARTSSTTSSASRPTCPWARSSKERCTFCIGKPESQGSHCNPPLRLSCTWCCGTNKPHSLNRGGTWVRCLMITINLLGALQIPSWRKIHKIVF